MMPGKDHIVWRRWFLGECSYAFIQEDDEYLPLIISRHGSTEYFLTLQCYALRLLYEEGLKMHVKFL